MSEDTAHLWPATENYLAAAQAIFVLPGLALSNTPPQPHFVVLPCWRCLICLALLVLSRWCLLVVFF